MDQRLSIITLGSSDLDRSTAFFERLGWKRSVKDAPGVRFFQCGGIALGLYPWDDLAKDAQVGAEGNGFRGVAIAYNARSKQEVDAILKEVEAAGATIVKPAQDVFWGGYSGYFRDPDGHLWEVAWNPGFALGEDGSLTLPD